MIPQLQKEASVSAPETNTEWSSSTKVAFRFVFSYFLLYMCPRAVGSLSQSAKNETVLDTIWHSVVPWFGQHVLHINGDYREVANGSGDQLYDYVLLLLIVILAAVAAAVWSWLDRKRPNYEVLYQWLRIVIRVTLAIMLMSYGCNKIFRTQFLEPSLMQLMQALRALHTNGSAVDPNGIFEALQLFWRDGRDAWCDPSARTATHDFRSTGRRGGHDERPHAEPRV